MLRTILAVLVGYGTNAALVAATEEFLPKFMRGTSYFVTDLITQCLYEVVAGYVCCLVSKRSNRRLAVFVLIGLGLLIGTISVVASWNAEPHWYQIGLLVVWAPCVWIGYVLANPATKEVAKLGCV
jgi:peptidoglycan/LPS O-acetylase OafA/YrhL